MVGLRRANVFVVKNLSGRSIPKNRHARRQSRNQIDLTAKNSKNARSTGSGPGGRENFERSLLLNSQAGWTTQ